MIYLFLIVSTIVFVEIFIATNILSSAHSISAASRRAISTFRSPEMSDDEKEIIIVGMSKDIAIATFVFSAKFILILLFLYGLYIAAVQLSLITQDEFLDSMQSLRTIIALTVLAVVYIQVRNVVLKRL